MSNLQLIVAVAIALSLACGSEIGDSCTRSTDCSPNGDRICDATSPGGYCTIVGCDFDTCPEDSICVRFFGAATSNRACDPQEEDRSSNDCSADELCNLSGQCVPRGSEVRFCMATCGGGGDCRDAYECRDEGLMKRNGGEPVPRPGEAVGSRLQPFCAAAPTQATLRTSGPALACLQDHTNTSLSY